MSRPTVDQRERLHVKESRCDVITRSIEVMVVEKPICTYAIPQRDCMEGAIQLSENPPYLAEARMMAFVIALPHFSLVKFFAPSQRHSVASPGIN